MRKRTQLLIYGWIFLVLAAIDAFTLWLDIKAGLFDALSHEDATVQNVANTVVYVVFGFAALSALISFYLGVMGIKESRNASDARLHIVLARVVGFINVVLMGILALSLLDSTDKMHDLETIGLCLIDIILMFSYASAAKAVRNGEA